MVQLSQSMRYSVCYRLCFVLFCFVSVQVLQNVTIENNHVCIIDAKFSHNASNHACIIEFFLNEYYHSIQVYDSFTNERYLL